jgi:DNA-directed RNA polymerase beta' subunit
MLKVLNINNFIKTNKVQEVTNRQSFTKEGKPTTDGLYSETIFGITSDEISTNFAYINLSTWIIHPSILGSLTKVSTLFKKVIYGDKKAVIENGMLVESENGSSGVGFLFNSWNKLDFKNYLTEKNKPVVNFFQTIARDEVFINKYLVVPPKFRMYTQKHGITVEDEITMFYKRLLGLTVIGSADNDLMQAILKNSNKDLEIQKAVIIIYDFFLSKLEKKEGQFRSSLISKRIDNNVRLVANARPDLPFNCAGLPWHVLLNIFDAFIVGSLNKNIFSEDYSKALGVEQFSSSKFGTHFDYIFRNVDTYTEANPGKREIWVKVLKEMFDYHPELKVLLKRDPAWNKDSYHALFPVIIPTNSFHIVVNSLLYKPLGGDSFNTNFTTGVKDNCICQDEDGYISTKSDQSYYIRSLNYLFDNLG